MIKTCEICGKMFDCQRNKKTCGPDCAKKLSNLRHQQYYQDHRERRLAQNKQWIKNNWERYKKYQHEYAVKRWATEKIEHQKVKDSWINKYEKADRLTKLSMMQLALTEHNISSMNYGYLSFIYGTDEYKKLEDKVFKVKEELD